MIIDIITLFPDFFKNPLDTSIIKRALSKKLVTINIYNLRKWAIDKYGSVDDHPYGGGIGMILRPEPIYNAINEIKKNSKDRPWIILLTPKGKIFNQNISKTLSQKNHLILICGHYEGFDERIRSFVDQEISIGKYILTGGEIPALVIIDSVTRLLPGVLKPEATQVESFSNNLKSFEYPQYTRPEYFRGKKVPKILLSGNHQKISGWKKYQSK